MDESIRNDGGFKGGETIVHAQGRTTPQALFQSASSTLSDALIWRLMAFKSDKVVTRVVTDLNFGLRPKHTRVLGENFIGEQNRSTKNNDLKTSGCLLHWVIVRFRDKARPHAPPTPGLNGIDPTQKYFCRF